MPRSDDEETVTFVAQSDGSFDTMDEAIQDALKYMPPGASLETHSAECEIATARCTCTPRTTSVFSETSH